MEMIEVKKGVFKKKGAIYRGAKDFDFCCKKCGSSNAGISIINFAVIHIVCNHCGNNDKIAQLTANAVVINKPKIF